MSETKAAPTIDKPKIEARILEGCPLLVTFAWRDDVHGGTALRISTNVQTQAGIPAVFVAFPPGMPPAYQPRAIARAKTLIGEIFDANMVGIQFLDQKPQIAVPQKSLLLPGSIMAGRG
jgi:hypothetical protein